MYMCIIKTILLNAVNINYTLAHLFIATARFLFHFFSRSHTAEKKHLCIMLENYFFSMEFIYF